LRHCATVQEYDQEASMGELNRGERLQIMLRPEELRLIDTWRFARRMPSRVSAIRELLKRGLAAEGFAEVEDGRKSKDFSVSEDAAEWGRRLDDLRRDQSLRNCAGPARRIAIRRYDSPGWRLRDTAPCSYLKNEIRRSVWLGGLKS
jgi:hypothetical protein